MRVPKFRTWLKFGHYMSPVLTLDFTEDCLTIIQKDTGHWEEYTFGDVTELMEFSGLKDKNGKEIYEEDIVKFSVDDGFNYCINEIGTVIYNNGAFYVGDFLLSDIESADIEVIGNIWEDSELLNY